MSGGRPARGEPDASLSSRVGVAVHAALLDIASSADPVTVSTVLGAAGRAARTLPLTPSRVRLGVQHVAPFTAAGVRMFPPPAWVFAGGERSFVGGRTDLMWSSGEGVFIDEVKTGSWRDSGLDRRTRDQVERLVAWGVAEHGSTFRGVRLLRLAAPLRSLWFPAEGSGPVPLDETAFWFGFTAPWETRR